MIKAGVGSSLNRNSRSAAAEAASQAMEKAGLTKADWAMVFCTFPHRDSYKHIIKSVCEITQTTNVMGCSAIGVLTNSEEIEGEPAIAVLTVSSDNILGTSFLVHDSAGDSGLQAGIEIGKRLNPLQSGNALLAILSDPFQIHPELLFRGIESELGEIPIVGAAASEHPYFDQTYEFWSDTVAAGAVSGLMLQGNFTHDIGIAQGCQPVGPPCIITKADRNIIFELDGLPATDVLMSKIPKSLLDDPDDLMRLVFAGFPTDPNATEIKSGDYVVRNLLGINTDSRIIGVAENVKEGQIMSFVLRHPTMAREDLKQMLDRLTSTKDPEKKYSFGFYFNCCARGSSLYGHTGIDTAYINQALGDIPLIGFFGNCEFGPLRGTNYVFTYTGVLVLISE